MDMNVSPRIQTLVRIRVLHKVIHELAQGFGIEDDSVLEVIRKGVFINQLLQSIYIYYMNNHGKSVGRVVIDVNWTTYELSARSENGREFQIDISQGSISEQITQKYKRLIGFTEDLRHYYNIQCVTARYLYRSEIYDDKIKLQEVRQYLGTCPGNFPETLRSSWDVSVTYKAEKLSELGLAIDFFKPSKDDNA